jgi:hypothetical protein
LCGFGSGLTIFLSMLCLASIKVNLPRCGARRENRPGSRC